jgi:hypothetical protein
MNETDDPILLTRRPDARTYVLALLMPFLAFVFTAGGVAAVQSLITPGRRPNSAWDYGLTAIVIALAAWSLWASFHFIRAAFTKAVFRTHSAQLVTLGWVRRSMQYRDCYKFTYHRQRNYKYGVWVGTYFRIKLAAPGLKSLALSGRHKERATLAGSSYFSKEFKGSDEIDLLPAHIGAIMADDWDARLAAGEQIRWLRGFVLTDAGVIPRYGPFKRQCVPYHRVYLIAESMEVCELVIEGERPMGVDIDTSTANFWPGAILIERRSSASGD